MCITTNKLIKIIDQPTAVTVKVFLFFKIDANKTFILEISNGEIEAASEHNNYQKV